MGKANDIELRLYHCVYVYNGVFVKNEGSHFMNPFSGMESNRCSCSPALCLNMAI